MRRILAAKMRNCKEIKGIIIDGEEFKMSQFADDTTLLLDGSNKSINTALNMLENFAKFFRH